VPLGKWPRLGIGPPPQRAKAAARLDLDVSAGWASPSSRGLCGVATLCCYLKFVPPGGAFYLHVVAGVMEVLRGTKLLKRDGTPAPANALEGKLVVLYFSGSWCAPCQAFLPLLKMFYVAAEPHGLQVRAVERATAHTGFETRLGRVLTWRGGVADRLLFERSVSRGVRRVPQRARRLAVSPLQKPNVNLSLPLHAGAYPVVWLTVSPPPTGS
jgi:thiol-disulfide isomerase/thioredoxin